jgi:hypothetical protein
MTWKNVKADGFPLCNSETVYVGINGAGYAGCFNSITDSPYENACWYDTPEGTSLILSGLSWWKPLEMPK